MKCNSHEEQVDATSGSGKGDSANLKSRGPFGSVQRRGVLIVEDMKLMRHSLQLGLEDRGFVVWAAGDGDEAVELYGRFGNHIDVVLSDVHMPVLDGPQTLDALRKINPDVRVCFMTADVRDSTSTQLLGLGARRVFAKPFPSIAQLADDLREVLVQSPAVFVTRNDAFCLTPSVEPSSAAEPVRPGGFLRWVVSLMTRQA